MSIAATAYKKKYKLSWANKSKKYKKLRILISKICSSLLALFFQGCGIKLQNQSYIFS